MTTGEWGTWGEMRQQDEYFVTISGLWEEPGLIDTSRGAQSANKTRTSYM